jgi:hypothetical protein
VSIFDGASPTGGFPALADLPWLYEPERALKAAREILISEQDLAGVLQSWLTGLSEDQAACAGMESRTTGTHDKWFLGAGRFSGASGRTYMVWLHDYFSPEKYGASGNFAASIHNHRYGFTSRVVSGGLNIVEFQNPDRDEGPLATKREFSIRLGETMSVSPKDIHRIVSVQPGTRTLLIQGPARSMYSTVYHMDGTRDRVYGHHALFNAMRSINRSVGFSQE